MTGETFVADVRRFTEAVGCTTDCYNARQTALYTGLQLEEMAEKLEALNYSDINHTGSTFTDLICLLHRASGILKGGSIDSAVEQADRPAMLDADVDLAWVTVGSMLSQGADVLGAMREVARANMSKLIGCRACTYDGKEEAGVEDIICDGDLCKGTRLIAVKDANGKVTKPAGWTPPDIAPFTCAED